MVVDTVIDRVLETTIVGSFSSIGYESRSRLEDWDRPPSMAGQNVVITGGSSGIGRSVAEGVRAIGANVCVTSRSVDKAEQVAQDLSTEIQSDGSVFGLGLDTGSRESIDAFVAAVTERFDLIDVLINNAGALTDDYRTDDSGMELTLSTHLVGPFALMCLLRPHYRPGARVLFMSSGGMYTQGLDVAHIELPERLYKGTIAYARAKRGQVEMVKYLGPRWAPDVILQSMHPGWVDTPGVDDALPGFARIMGPVLRTAEQGADTMVWLAATGGGDAPPGSFFHDRRVRGTSYAPKTGTNDTERARLLEWLETTTGLSAALPAG
jgi:NAD(P)-dependent dehydrogenase (short-subunit alcohol dehydrogenase family)